MSTDPCPCCGGNDGPSPENEASTDPSMIHSAPLDTELPRELRLALGRFLGADSVDTLGEWATEVRQQISGGSISIDELCLTDGATEHWGSVEGERYHFACFYDAVILAALSDRPADVRTKSPDGTVIQARVVGSTGLTVTPEETVFSFGIGEAVEPPSDDGPTLERGYAALCPYVKAFPDPDAYERWAEHVPAATIAMPLAGATGLAAELVSESST